MWQYNYNNELMHYGVKGMKWGVRRYQNKDGSLTPAGKKRATKELNKELKKNKSMFKRDPELKVYSDRESYKKFFKKVVTNDDKKAINRALNKWSDALDGASEAEEQLDYLANKHGEKYYNDEIRRNPNMYNTPRSQEKLNEFAVLEYGYDRASKERPDLVDKMNAPDKAWEEYTNECKKVADKLLNEYGGIDASTNPSTIQSARNVVSGILMELDN